MIEEDTACQLSSYMYTHTYEHARIHKKKNTWKKRRLSRKELKTELCDIWLESLCWSLLIRPKCVLLPVQ